MSLPGPGQRALGGWPRKTLTALVLCGATVLQTGCHHKRQTTSYSPPPPATTRRGHARAPSIARAPAAPEATSPAAQAPQGKPFSTEVGLASWYGPPYANRKGANGQIYNQNAMTAAHRTLPFGTMVRVTNLANGESAMVRITDRGPFVHDRILDLSLAAAKATGVYRAGVAKVKIEVYSMPARASGENHWCVQVGAFTKPNDAVKLRDDLRRRYQTAKVIEFPGPTGHWVRISPAQPDKHHADEIAQSIKPKEAAAGTYVVRTN